MLYDPIDMLGWICKTGTCVIYMGMTVDALSGRGNAAMGGSKRGITMTLVTMDSHERYIPGWYYIDIGIAINSIQSSSVAIGIGADSSAGIIGRNQ